MPASFILLPPLISILLTVRVVGAEFIKKLLGEQSKQFVLF